MNIDIESICLLSLILQDSPKDRQLILCTLARSNQYPPYRIKFHTKTEYPTFYAYFNDKIPLYLMTKKVPILCNVPRVGSANRILSASNLSQAETVINRANTWDESQKLEYVAKFISLENHTNHIDAVVYLIYRRHALWFINRHRDEISTFIRQPPTNQWLIESLNDVLEKKNEIITQTMLDNTAGIEHSPIERDNECENEQKKEKEIKEKQQYEKNSESDMAYKKSTSDKVDESTKWEEIAIQFMNGQEVIIKIKGKVWKHTTCEEMGFINKKNSQPNKQWQLLQLLSLQNGELSWDGNRKLSLSRREMDTFKKKKQRLAEALQTYFGIQEDSFYEYKKEGSYKIKVLLIPEQEGISNYQSDALGIDEYIKEQSPNVYEKDSGDVTD